MGLNDLAVLGRIYRTKNCTLTDLADIDGLRTSIRFLESKKFIKGRRYYTVTPLGKQAYCKASMIVCFGAMGEGIK